MDERTWPRIRGALIFLGLAVHLLYAMPMPHRVTKSVAKRPESREELDRWHAILTGVGVPIARDDFETEVIEWTHAISDGHRALKKPFRPLMSLTGTGQGWALFAAPDTYPNRLEVAVRVEGRWETVFARLSPEARFLAPTLTYRRVRGIWDGASVRQSRAYKNLCKWAADHAFEAYPDADRARVQLVQTHTTLPWEPSDPGERARQVRIYKRPVE